VRRITATHTQLDEEVGTLNAAKKNNATTIEKVESLAAAIRDLLTDV